MRSGVKKHMNPIKEGVEYGELSRLINPELSIDQYRSKMGNDKDIIVLAFTVFGKLPATDLVDFIEKSYDWVLDADVSSGETSDGNYMVFVELEREKNAPTHIYVMMEDLMNLTLQKLEKDWKFVYFKSHDRHPLNEEMLQQVLILSPEDYDRKTEDSKVEESAELNALRAAAGISVKPQRLTDAVLSSIQVLAGIK